MGRGRAETAAASTYGIISTRNGRLLTMPQLSARAAQILTALVAEYIDTGEPVGSARLLQVIAGRDEMDATSALAPVPDYVAALDGNVRGMKIGVPTEWLQGLASEIGDPVQAAIDALAKLGAEIREVHLPHTQYAIACYYIICTAEASSNLARYDGVRYTTRSAAAARRSATVAAPVARSWPRPVRPRVTGAPGLPGIRPAATAPAARCTSDACPRPVDGRARPAGCACAGGMPRP